MNLNKEININKKVIIWVIFVCILGIGLYSSYAWFQLNTIKNNVVVLRSGTINLNASIQSNTRAVTNTVTIAGGATSNTVLNLTSSNATAINYKLTYEVVSGDSSFNVSSDGLSAGPITGEMTASKSIALSITNLGTDSITLQLSAEGNVINRDVLVTTGAPLLIGTNAGGKGVNIQRAMLNNPNCQTYLTEDNILYLSGTKECIGFNYVWYSGKLWKITAINPDGTMKLVTDYVVSTFPFYTDSTFNGSWVYQFINEDFLDTLNNYSNIINTSASWNTTTTTNVATKLGMSSSTTAAVGLLNTYEYYKSYQNATAATSYLANQSSWWLSNPYIFDYFWYWCSLSRSNPGTVTNSLSTLNNAGVRPAIVLKANVGFVKGIGTKTDPYVIDDGKYKTSYENDLLNTRTVGEYVNFAGSTYRISEKLSNGTKLIMADYLRDSNNEPILKVLSSGNRYGDSGNSNTDTYWDYYLNNTWRNSLNSAYSNMMITTTYYDVRTDVGGSYKNYICSSTNNTTERVSECAKSSISWNGYVAIPRYGEMFGNGPHQDDIYNESWTISGRTSTENWITNDSNGYASFADTTNRVRPIIAISDVVKIVSGDGTETNPFEISMPSSQR